MADEALVLEIEKLGLNPKKAYTQKDLIKARRKQENKSIDEKPQLKSGFVELPKVEEKTEQQVDEPVQTDDLDKLLEDVIDEEVVPVEVADDASVEVKPKRMPPGRKKKVVVEE